MCASLLDVTTDEIVNSCLGDIVALTFVLEGTRVTPLFFHGPA